MSGTVFVYLIMVVALFGLLAISLFAPYLIGVMLACRYTPKSDVPELNPIVVATALLLSYLFAAVVSFSDWGAPHPFSRSTETFGSYLVGEKFAPFFWIPVAAGLPLGYAFGWLWQIHMTPPPAPRRSKEK